MARTGKRSGMTRSETIESFKGFLDEGGHIRIGSMFRGQKTYVEWFMLECDEKFREDDIIGWVVTPEDVEAWPELRGREIVRAWVIDIPSESRLEIVEIDDV
jgi:hypothetical protein